ncbi:plasmid recombination protein [Roseateles sp. P5_E4]
MGDGHAFAHGGEMPGGGVYVGVRGVHPERVLPAFKHNLRHLIPGHPCPAGCNPALTSANEVLQGALCVDDAQRAMADALALHGLVPPQRKDASWLVEVVFSAPPGLARHGDYLRECVALLARQTAGLVISAVVHRDQGAPHVHCLLLPIEGGRWVGSRLLDKKRVMKLRAALFSGPAATYGLRQPARLSGARKVEGVRLVMARMSQSPARECPFWPVFQACIEANPAPFLARMGVDVPAEPARSFTAIMTGTGRRTSEDARRPR